jgi:hypothetical protein
MTPQKREIFLSYSGEDSLVASLLQVAVERLLADLQVRVWTYERDQVKSERNVGRSLKRRVRKSKAILFLVSRATLNSGASQWMELAYADAYDVPIFVVLHEMSYKELLAREHGVPPLLVAGQCNPSSEWKAVVAEIRRTLKRQARSRAS